MDKQPVLDTVTIAEIVARTDFRSNYLPKDSQIGRMVYGCRADETHREVVEMGRCPLGSGSSNFVTVAAAVQAEQKLSVEEHRY